MDKYFEELKGIISNQEQSDDKPQMNCMTQEMANVTVRADADCFLLCDGEYLDIQLEAGKMTKIQAPIGQHLLEFLYTENPDIKVEKAVDFPEAGKSYLVIVKDLKDAVDKAIREEKIKAEEEARRQKEEERERQEKILAEQKRIEEEKHQEEMRILQMEKEKRQEELRILKLQEEKRQEELRIQQRKEEEKRQEKLRIQQKKEEEKHQEEMRILQMQEEKHQEELRILRIQEEKRQEELRIRKKEEDAKRQEELRIRQMEEEKKRQEELRIRALQPVPYAVISDNKRTLTFYYDNKKNSRFGMGLEVTVERRTNWSQTIRKVQWGKYGNSVTKVVFDDSFSNCHTINNLGSWFYFFTELNSIMGLTNLNTENVTDMSSMFSNCNSLSKLDLSGFNTKNVEDMSFMFDRCESLEKLDLRNFDTKNVVDMRHMFCFCSSLQSLDLKKFNTENVKDMSVMFNSCTSLQSLDLSNFDTRKVEHARAMFSGCSFHGLNISFNLNRLDPVSKQEVEIIKQKGIIK